MSKISRKGGDCVGILRRFAEDLMQWVKNVKKKMDDNTLSSDIARVEAGGNPRYYGSEAIKEIIESEKRKGE